MSSVLGNFHPAVRGWFGRRFGQPSRAQELGWPVISSGQDVLLCAPTGSGKTLAAFMWAIDRLVREVGCGMLRDQVSVLYVSPLKALANDIRLNLDQPLEGVRQAAREAGLSLAEIRAGLRTGDTPAGERSAMLRRPPHILVTTPESLFILLASPRFRDKLKSVRYVIVDELHALAGNKRGAHLAVTLERLERMITGAGTARPVRIGLSATLNPIERLAAFLGGGEIDRAGIRHARPLRIVRAEGEPRAVDLKVVAPGPELGPLATHEHWEAMYERIAELVREHRTTLVFTLSRRWAERIALGLQKRLGAAAVMAHHGSLARQERLEAEQRLKRGELKAIVATASLELGIDVGAVELVCQVDSPKSITAAIQRIGRSGHALDATPKGRLLALTLDDLLECAAAVRAIRRGHLDAVEIPKLCLDVAAQQIVAIAAEEGEIAESELLALLRGAYNFAGLDAAELRRLLEQLAAELPDRIQGAAPKIFYDRMGGRVRARRGARLAAITSGGTIPESGNYDVVIESSGRKIGDVEEDFAQESSRGDVFALGSTPWQIRRISRGRLLVEPAPGMAPTLPFWMNEAGGRSPALSAEVAELRREIAARLGDRLSLATWLKEQCALEPRDAEQAAAYVARGLAALGTIPDQQTIIAERFFDGLGGTQIVIHSPLGIRFNRGLGLALRKRLCQSFDFEIQASAIDDGVLLALNSRHSFPLEQIFTMIGSHNAREVLTQAVLDAPMFEVRLRHVATRALMIMRNLRGRRVPAWIQRLRAQDLTVALFPGQQACFENRPPIIEIPDHFVVREAIRECLEESADIARLTAVLGAIEGGAIRTVAVDSISPSAFAQRLLLAWDYSFLDGGERANRRSRTVALNRGMAEDVFRNENLSELLAPEVVESVAADATGTTPARRARDHDELYELVRAHGALSPDLIADRTAGDGAAMVGALEAAGRVVRVRLPPLAAGGQQGPNGAAAEVLIVSDDLPLFAAAYPEAQLHVPAGAGPVEPDAACEELVYRVLRTSGPCLAADLARRLGMARQQVQQRLAALEAKGSIFRGQFTRSVEQWCERYNLERIHRLTLARIRTEIEPCSDREFAAFRLRWQHVGGANLPQGAEGVAAVLEQLAGMALTPEFWERAVLPARVAGYRPEYLDRLCMSGRMVWVAAPEDDEAAEWPSRVAFLGRRQSWPWERRAGAQCAEPREAAVIGALSAGGAQYLDELADRAGLSERDALGSLWRLAARGRVTNDGFAALRILAASPAAQRMIGHPERRSATRQDAALRARLRSSLSGRWVALVERAGDGGGAAGEQERALALALLARNGILAREMLALESSAPSWTELSFMLRRLEYAGTIRRGYFVHSLSGEQYALPEALEMLRQARALNPAREGPLALSAADPANPYGAVLPGCGIDRDAANLVVIRAGEVIMGLAARGLITLGELDDESFGAALAALVALGGKLTIATIDGCPALSSKRVGLMAAMRFHSDGRALTYDGLPGPPPARARGVEARPG